MSKRKAYVNDYDISTELVKEGKKVKEKKNITYHGKYYRFQMDDQSLKKMKYTYLFFGLVLFFLFVGLGLLNNEASRIIYVVMPYVFLFLPIFYTNMGTIKLLKRNVDMTAKEYDDTIIRLKKTTLSLLVLSIACALGDILYLVTHKVTDFMSKEYVFLSGILLIIGLSILFMQQQKTLNKKIIEIGEKTVKNG